MTRIISAPQDRQAWISINWQQVEQQVRKVQVRIVKAVQKGEWRKVRSLQQLVVNSKAAKQLAVRRVTQNKGKNTPGVDGQTWSTPTEKEMAVTSLNWKGYRPQPLKRVYIPKQSGRRPLGIPTMRDRAMQMLQKLALEPIAETRGDPHSYGFRPWRSAHDAIQHSHTLFSRRGSAEWGLDADIKGCFDHINHDWLLKNIPIKARILRGWLKSGYIEKNIWNPTQEGTPQGGIISPLLANMTLDGLQQHLAKHFRRSRPQGQNDKVNLVRYCDDFIISGVTREIIESRVRPLVESFLKERGLTLSENKTHIVHISEGFDFLGFTLRKYPGGKFLIQPSKKSQKHFLSQIKYLLKELKQATQAEVVARLCPVITGWCNYFRHVAAKSTFSRLSHRIWQKLWRWSRRRHPNKSRKWIKLKYFPLEGKERWSYGYWGKNQDGKKLFRSIPRMSRIAIKRHPPIKSILNPYDPIWELYVEERHIQLMKGRLNDMISKLWGRQKGKCGYCQTFITTEMRWHLHHILPRSKGGRLVLDNLTLLHPNCHRQLHGRATAGLSVPDSLLHA